MDSRGSHHQILASVVLTDNGFHGLGACSLGLIMFATSLLWCSGSSVSGWGPLMGMLPTGSLTNTGGSSRRRRSTSSSSSSSSLPAPGGVGLRSEVRIFRV